MNLQHTIAANDSPKMHAFVVTVGPRGNPRLHFEAIGTDSCSVVAQHADLAEVGERVQALPLIGEPLPYSEEELLAADREINARKATPEWQERRAEHAARIEAKHWEVLSGQQA